MQVSQSGWQWGNPTPQGNTIRAIDFAQGRGYAIGDDGTALRTDDGGATWTGLPTGTSLDLNRIQAVTPDVVTILGGDGCVLRRSDDGGRTFRRFYVLTEIDCPEPVAATYFVTPQLGYILLRNGNVLRTTDGGESFSRVTAIPGTPGSAGGGNATPADAIFTSPDAGIVFLSGTNTALRTTDAGASWTPEPDVAGGSVRRLEAIDATTFYAFGPDTLLRSTDAGQSWQAKPVAATITGVSCATLDLCLLTTDRGDRLLRTENGGDTTEPITAATAPLYAAGFANPARAVAAGVGGATAVSNDAGRNYTPVGGDIAGSFGLGLRLGPAPNIALALGSGGQLARTTDNGVTWRAINVATSSNLRDTSFSSENEGYALDFRGGLFRTSNGGASWSPIDPGTTSAPLAVITRGDTVLLAGPRGVRRATGGGQFSAVENRTRVTTFDRAGSTIFAYGRNAAIRSTNGGRRWTTVRRPGRLADLDMTSANGGYALTTDGRVWRTTNGGRRWRELAAVGTSRGLALAFGSSTHGYLTLSGYPADVGVAYVLRTSDGGRHWRPQRISAGQFPGTEGVISPSASRSYALTSTPAVNAGVFRSLFTTASGGDFGTRSTITLNRARRSGRTVTVTGRLNGAQGGEPIVVSARTGSRWTEQVVTAGANGGRFTASFRLRGRASFVARWAGDSGRQGAGSSALRGPR
ncbi:hypothetical protein DVA67_033205 [Solirubrobacter sp. CPCC 204708]|uniref:Photosynthesis system II assembly factor Ycf48/Hcf136-like domain-containing protein n=1 Tax=Solirubrobacter deserti TaxID=2282478 RepID=A0ABT4RIY5_9ACTN|nr:hypothetical protein [Solirubrobacter deserti]MBE2320864.1 hypothetical protein [Solirubrobacter deserti]MDA0138499.1 hypothetical protein [Solirubrobacter deserti]